MGHMLSLSPSLRRSLFLRNALAAVLVALAGGAISAGTVATTGCKLSVEQAKTAAAIVNPLCDVAGAAASAVPYTAADGSIVAFICKEVEAEILAAETVAPDGGAAGDGGAVAAALPGKLVLTSATSCKAVPIPGDPRHQTACPELHALILAAGDRIDSRKARAGAPR